MWGVQCMHNFGKIGTSHDTPDDTSKEKPKRVDEEDAMEGGLKGRISAGAEFYLSTKEKSAGGMCIAGICNHELIVVGVVSAAVRFTTLPDATPPSAQVPQPPNGVTPPGSPPSQPPTTITAMFNPIVGHMSGAYAAHVSRDLSLCSRFDFNVYSYESEWSFGAEWWTRRHKPKSEQPAAPDLSSPSLPLVVMPAEQPSQPQNDEIQGVVKAHASTTAVRVSASFEKDSR